MRHAQVFVDRMEKAYPKKRQEIKGVLRDSESTVRAGRLVVMLQSFFKDEINSYWQKGLRPPQQLQDLQKSFNDHFKSNPAAQEDLSEEFLREDMLDGAIAAALGQPPNPSATQGRPPRPPSAQGQGGSLNAAPGWLPDSNRGQQPPRPPSAAQAQRSSLNVTPGWSANPYANQEQQPLRSSSAQGQRSSLNATSGWSANPYANHGQQPLRPPSAQGQRSSLNATSGWSANPYATRGQPPLRPPSAQGQRSRQHDVLDDVLAELSRATRK